MSSTRYLAFDDQDYDGMDYAGEVNGLHDPAIREIDSPVVCVVEPGAPVVWLTLVTLYGTRRDGLRGEAIKRYWRTRGDGDQITVYEYPIEYHLDYDTPIPPGMDLVYTGYDQAELREHVPFKGTVTGGWGMVDSPSYTF